MYSEFRARHITSRANPHFKALRAALKGGGDEESAGMAWIEGAHLLREYTQRIGAPHTVVVSQTAIRRSEIQTILASCGAAQTWCLGDALFAQLSCLASAAGILARIAIVPPSPPADLPAGDAVLLVGVQDAGNVGAILRTAAAAGVGRVFIGAGCARPWSLRVLRAAQGAHFALTLMPVENPAAVIHAFPGRSLAAVAHGGDDLYTQDLRGDTLWIFGNEGGGLAPALCAQAQGRVCIPLHHFESLNVAAAAAICLFESRRQKHSGLKRIPLKTQAANLPII